MNDRRTPALATMKNDTRGAVLMIAVFMSAFLVGALWYVIGIGDAAIYRQYMQDGADAVAFGSAVYHARGMNIIALINLVMAAVLMVLVAFKIGQILLIAANIASCLIGAFLDPVCDITSAAEEPYAVWVNRVETIVDKILRVLYQTSNAVAMGMPWVAEGKAVFVAGDYRPTVHGGVMASVSLIPGPLEKAVGGLIGGGGKTGGAEPGKTKVTGAGTAEAGKGAAAAAEDPNAGMRWGLPVQDDDFAVLCQHAGKDVVSFVFLPFNFLGLGGLASGVESFAGGMVGGLVKTFPGYFCGGMSDMATSLGSTVKKWATKGSKDSIAKLCDKKKTDAAKSKDKSGFSYDKCMKAGGALDKLGGGSELGAGKTSKKVYDPATLGDSYFAVWSFDWGNLADQSHANKGVDIAGWNYAHAGEAGIFSKIGVAQAEFYYEPKADDPDKHFKPSSVMGTAPGWFKDKGTQGLADDAMWNMRWRARLRRVHLPSPSIGGIIASKISDHIKVPIVGDMLKYPLDKIGEKIDDKVKEVIGSATGDLIVH